MSVYDLDRRERSLKKRTETGGSSLTLHLHPSHCRFEHQNGVFLYDSPIRSLLRSIRDGRLPTELLDLLDATDVRYFEGCLVVEVHDHREADINNSSNGASGSKEGQDSTSSAAAGNALLNGSSGSHLGKRSNDGTLLKQAGLSSSNELNSSSDPSVAASQFRFNFINSFKRFEEARMDIQRKIEQRRARDAANAAAQAIASQQTQSESNAAASGSQPPNEMSSALHSAVAAAVAAAPEDTATVTAAQQGNKSAVPVYKIVLAPDTETIWMDLLVMREGKKKKWTEREMVEMEAKILATAGPPLCLEPDMQVSRIANRLLDDTCLPYDLSMPLRAPLASTSKVKKGNKAARLSKNGKPAIGKKKLKKRSVQQEQEEVLNAEEAALQRKLEEEEEAAARAEAERAEAEAWLLVMDEKAASSGLSRHGAGFQPSFSRFAFLQNWKDNAKEAKRREAEEAAHEKEREARAAAKQKQQALPPTEERQASGDIAIPRSPSKANSGSRSASHSRQGSVIDVPVPGAPENQPKPAQAAPPAAAPKKKKKAAVADGGAGASNNSGPTGLKLTLPGKKADGGTKKGKNAKAGSPDISVGTPASAGPASANGTNGMPPAAQQPSMAQQAINRKTANLPKAKLKSDVKAQQQNNAGGVNGSNSQQGSPAPTTAGLPNGMGQMVNGLALPNGQAPQLQQQRAFSPMPGQAQQQQFQPNAAQNQAMQQAYLNQLQQSGMLPSRQQMSSSPFNNTNMQLPNGGQQAFNAPQQSQQPAGGQYVNIHRSPSYNNAGLPNQQQAYNPYNTSASPVNAQQLAGFTPQQALQLQQLQQQQQQQQTMMQHQQALQSHISSLPSNFGQNLFAQQVQQQQALGPGPGGQLQVHLSPQQRGMQGQMPQFSQAMLDQLRQQQLMAGTGQGAYNAMNQGGGQQMQWSGQR